MAERLPMKTAMRRTTSSVLNVEIDVLTWSQAIERISAWSRARESRVVCICNAHSIVEAGRDPTFRAAVVSADMATPDGAPVAYVLRQTGFPQQQRINGPDLMWRYCEHAASTGEAVFLYGATDETLASLQERLLKKFPSLQIAGAYSPPFRPLTDAEEAQIVEMINCSGAGVVWVGLGCPKQEKWMCKQRGQIQAVMVGVGAAFDYHAGTIRRAPKWMQDSGLEWLHRLASEPRRLWRRYLVTNTLFVMGALRQLARARRS